MSDDQQTKSQTDAALDPTTNAQDLMGDTHGMTGITTNQSTHKGKVFDQQDQNTLQPNQVMSQAAQKHAQEIASDNTNKVSGYGNTDGIANASQNHQQDLTSLPGEDNFKFNTGLASDTDELSVSGSTPDPDSDDDTLANAQAMGQQLNEDTEHPEELDIARDIDKAEEDIQSH